MSGRRPYVESPVIMATVRLVAPFVLTYGLFVTLHGASSPGGGFQGGVIVASVLVMISFAYGIDLTWEWLDKRALVGIAAGGVALFGAIALGPVLFEGVFFDLRVYPGEDSSKYGIELVEVAIAMIVTGIVTVMFFVLSRGTMPTTDDADHPDAAFDAAHSSEERGATADGGVRRARDRSPDGRTGGDDGELEGADGTERIGDESGGAKRRSDGGDPT